MNRVIGRRMANNVQNTFFDSSFPEQERLPRRFNVQFEEVRAVPDAKVRITIDDQTIGDSITDNSHSNDFYRFHDVFHFSYVAVLGWSPCVRNMLRRKRKSDPKIDEVEDGARAIITEEAISLLVFSYAKQGSLFTESGRVDHILLKTIGRLVADFEVSNRSSSEWEKAILMGYEIFRSLVENRKGVVKVDMVNRELSFSSR
jgi:hypothetical protein